MLRSSGRSGKTSAERRETVRIHLPFSLCAITFMLSVLLRGAAQLATIHSYVSPINFWAAVAVLAFIYGGLLAHLLRMDGHSRRNNNKILYEKWLAEHADANPDATKS